MSNIYINDVKIEYSLIKSMSSYIKNIHTKTNNDNVYITFDVPSYDADDVAKTYITKKGILSKRDKCTCNNTKIMLGIYALNPNCVDLKDVILSNTQITYLLNKYEDVMIKNGTIDKLYNIISIKYEIDEQITCYIESDRLVVKVLQDIVLKMLKHAKFMYDINNENVVKFNYNKLGRPLNKHRNKFEYNIGLDDDAMKSINKTDNLKSRSTSNNIDRNNINDNGNNTRFRNKINNSRKRILSNSSDADVTTNNNNLSNNLSNSNKLLYQLYNYKSHMTIVNNNSELLNVLRNKNTTNIFINYNLDISEDNNIISIINKIKPQDFATWGIGPNCKSCISLFYKYPNTPHISEWALEHIINCTKMFARSNITDCSNLCFYSCVYADFMFNKCEVLTRLPKFYSLNSCYKMCNMCINLLSVDDALCNTTNLYNINRMFNKCSSIKHAFNGCMFSSLQECNATFSECKSLETAMNCCLFGKSEEDINIYLVKTFIGCNALNNALNDCKFENMYKIKHILYIFDDCDDLRYIFNNCEDINVNAVKTPSISIICYKVSESMFYNTELVE